MIEPAFENTNLNRRSSGTRGRLSLLDHRGVIRYDAIYDYC
jgi:hypothetical protein